MISNSGIWDATRPVFVFIGGSTVVYDKRCIIWEALLNSGQDVL